jgi:hypothetical protein
MDLDAESYIDAVFSAGSTVSGEQQAAINTFFKEEKMAGRYALLKRLYLPIWGDAAANAIDMVSRTSGTFVGTVTHGAGFVQGDGTTGYFDFGVSPQTLGLTPSSQAIVALVKNLSASVANNNYLMGAFDNASKALVLAAKWRGIINTATGEGNVSFTAENPTGIVMLNRSDGIRGVYIRRTDGITTVVETTSADAGAIPESNMHVWSMNSNGSPTISRDDELGFYGMSMGLGSTGRSQYLANIKNLWETCTGLTLP